MNTGTMKFNRVNTKFTQMLWACGELLALDSNGDLHVATHIALNTDRQQTPEIVWASVLQSRAQS